MVKDLDKMTSGVLKVGAVVLTVNPPIIIATAVGVSCFYITHTVCSELTKSGKSVKFSIKDIFHLEAEFNK